MLTILALMGQAMAGGFFFADSGIVENGRGGASVAGAEGQFAQYYNPAGLARSTDVEINFGFSYAAQFVTFTRVDDAGTTMDPVSNQRPGMEIPQLGVVVPLPANLVAAFGVYSPFATGTAYEADGPQRFSMIDASLGLLHIGPSLAWRPIPQFSIGAGFQWDVLWVTRNFDVLASYTDVEDPQFDVNVDAAVTDAFTPNFNVGIIVEPIEQISIGVSFQPPARYVANGPASLDFSEHFFYQNDIITGGLDDEGKLNDEDVSIALDLPMMLRAGIAVRPIPTLEIEAAFVWENWATLEALVVENVDASLDTLAGEQAVPESIELPSGFSDAWSARLGAEYDINPLVTARLGGFYEKPALGPATQSVSLLDLDKVQIGGGASINPLGGRLGIDLMVAYLWMPELTMTDSEVMAINALEEDQTFGVGNGTYSAFGFKAGLQLRYRFIKADK